MENEGTIKEVIDKLKKRYDYVGDFHEDLAKVKLNGKWGFVNEAGIEVIHPQFDEARDFKDGLAQVELQGKYGYIRKDKLEEIPDIGFISSSDNLTPIQRNGKYGYVNKNAEMLVSPMYNDEEEVNKALEELENGKDGTHK